jgi:hypothetical protein
MSETVIRCSKCDAELLPDAQFCGHCGAPTPTRERSLRPAATVLGLDAEAVMAAAAAARAAAQSAAAPAQPSGRPGQQTMLGLQTDGAPRNQMAWPNNTRSMPPSAASGLPRGITPSAAPPPLSAAGQALAVAAPNVPASQASAMPAAVSAEPDKSEAAPGSTTLVSQVAAPPALASSAVMHAHLGTAPAGRALNQTLVGVNIGSSTLDRLPPSAANPSAASNAGRPSAPAAVDFGRATRSETNNSTLFGLSAAQLSLSRDSAPADPLRATQR